MTKMPDRLYIEKNDKEKYEKIKGESIFRELDNKDLFIFSMAYGFIKNASKELESKEGYVRTEYLNEEDLTMIYSLAIHEESINILTDDDKICKIAEKYANGGIKLLYDKINIIQFGSFEKHFEKELFDIYNQIKDDKND